MRHRFPSFDEFSALAEELVQHIPDTFMRGLAGITVSPVEVEDEEVPGVYILGHYTHGDLYEPYIDIYYGSFRQVFHGAPLAEIQDELWETILHELRHHLEESAGLEDLRVFDDLQQEYHRLKFEATPEDLRRLPAEPAYNVKVAGDRLLADLVLQPSEAPRQIKVDLGLEESGRQHLLVDFARGVEPGSTAHLRLDGKLAQRSGCRHAYLSVHAPAKRLRIRTLAGFDWLVFEPAVKKRELFRAAKGDHDAGTYVATPVNRKAFARRVYFDVFVDEAVVDAPFALMLPAFTASGNAIRLRFQPQEFAGDEVVLTRRLSNMALPGSPARQEVYLTIHLFD